MTTARFKINGTASSPPGFDGTNGQTITLQLEASPAPDVYSVQFSIYAPAVPDSPLASKDAPVVALSPSSGHPTTPTGTVTFVLPGSDAHSYLVRCVVNNGVDAATGAVMPDWTYERIVSIRTGDGQRKIVPGENREYSPRGWTDAQNEMVGGGGGGSTAWKDAVDAVATNDQTLSGEWSIDSCEFSADARILVTGKTDRKLNGIWIMKSGAWVRATDADSSEDFARGFSVRVLAGSVNGGSVWWFTANGPIELGVSGLNFEGSVQGPSARFGSGCSASGAGSLASGADSSATAPGTFAHGNSAEASAGYAEAAGFQTVADGTYSRAFGYSSEAHGSCSEARGELAETTQEAEEAVAQGGFAFEAGTAQRRSFVLRGSTPGEANAEAVVLKFGLLADQEIALLTGHFYNVEVRAILGHNSASTGNSMPGAFYQIGEVIVHGTSGAVTPVQHDLFAADLGGDLGAATLVWSSSGAGNLRLTFTVGSGKKQKVNIVALVTLVDALVPSWNPPS